MQLQVPKVGISGHPSVWLVGSDGRTKFKSDFKNIVLNHFFDDPMVRAQNSSNFTNLTAAPVFGDGRESFNYPYVSLGAGVQTPPQPDDSGLNNLVAHSEKILGDGVEIGSVQGTTQEDDYWFFKVTAEFDEDTANADLTEVGLTAYMSSRDDSTERYRTDFKSLIKDSDGNPVVVKKQQGDRLIVSYEIRLYRPPIVASAPFSLAHNDGQFRFVSFTCWDGSLVDKPYTEWNTLDIPRFSTQDVLRNGVMVANNASGSQVSAWRYITSRMLRYDTQIPPVTEDREMGPIMTSERWRVIRFNASNRRLGLDIRLISAPSGSLSAMDAAGILGCFVDAETGVMRPIHIPANHRLSFTLFPEAEESEIINGLKFFQRR